MASQFPVLGANFGVGAVVPPPAREKPPAGYLARLRANFPASLIAGPHWAVSNGTDTDKAPRIAIPGTPLASSTNRATWRPYEQAAAIAEQYGMYVGRFLAAEQYITCLDLDVKTPDSHPTKPHEWTTPEQYAYFRQLIRQFNSYTERSRSGNGWHVWMRGTVGQGRRSRGIELYSRDRFIICTGDVFRDE